MADLFVQVVSIAQVHLRKKTQPSMPSRSGLIDTALSKPMKASS
ncbi:hypothetical protein BF49_6498 [Bradyrhizobium sp.]|nr:hypothetical protein BF49_6498 [Bradyrhizobium sp.]